MALKNYDDIANYIVEQIQLTTVHQLPDEFWNGLNPKYGSVFRMPLYMSADSKNTFFIECQWNPPGEFKIVFFDADGLPITTFVYRR